MDNVEAIFASHQDTDIISFLRIDISLPPMFQEIIKKLRILNFEFVFHLGSVTK